LKSDLKIYLYSLKKSKAFYEEGTPL